MDEEDKRESDVAGFPVVVVIVVVDLILVYSCKYTCCIVTGWGKGMEASTLVSTIILE